MYNLLLGQKNPLTIYNPWREHLIGKYFLRELIDIYTFKSSDSFF